MKPRCANWSLTLNVFSIMMVNFIESKSNSDKFNRCLVNAKYGFPTRKWALLYQAWEIIASNVDASNELKAVRDHLKLGCSHAVILNLSYGFMSHCFNLKKGGRWPVFLWRVVCFLLPDYFWPIFLRHVTIIFW